MYDAIVLAGGRARRLGGIDKPGLVVAGSSLLDHVLAAVADAATVVCVGPARPTARQVSWCREDPPGSGPVAGLAAGLGATPGACDTVLVLAADLVFVAPAVPALVSALSADPGADSAALVDTSGRLNHLAAAWRRPALLAALSAVGNTAGAPMRALGASARVVPVPDPSGWGRDCDTWDDVEAVRTTHEERIT